MPTMRSFALASGVLLLLSLARAGAVLVDSLGRVPAGWRDLGPADPAQAVRLRVALAQPNLALFEQTLYDISTPEHPLYGRHLSRQEVRALMKPADASTTAVLAWLEAAGVPAGDIEDDGEWINFRTNVSTAESLLDTDFAMYRRVPTGVVRRLRTLRYSVPEEVRSHITMIQPTTRFGGMARRGVQISRYSEKDAAAARYLAVAADVPPKELNVTLCNSTITPDCLRALYRINDTVADPCVPTTLGVSGFLEVSGNASSPG